MKAIRFLIFIILGLWPAIEGWSQVRDVSVIVGANVPMYKGVESDVVLEMNYGQFYHNGLGFRAGLQWSPTVADVDHYVGVPLSFAWRMRSRSTNDRLLSGAGGVYDSIACGDEDGPFTARNVFVNFLINLFSDMEFFAGLTPGYVAGQSSSVSEASWGDSWQYWQKTWTEKNTAFSLMADAGFCLNYSIWRFDIKLKPSVHYSLTKNYLYHSASGDTLNGTTTSSITTLRWFFTFSGGLSFRF
ncbi:MAG: hypothetical protein ACI4UJ_04205 [Candidatus Cryptobacteroides sp.]